MTDNKTNTRVAIVYDFDGTLAPGNMQEPGFLKELEPISKISMAIPGKASGWRAAQFTR